MHFFTTLVSLTTSSIFLEIPKTFRIAYLGSFDLFIISNEDCKSIWKRFYNHLLLNVYYIQGLHVAIWDLRLFESFGTWKKWSRKFTACWGIVTPSLRNKSLWFFSVIPTVKMIRHILIKNINFIIIINIIQTCRQYYCSVFNLMTLRVQRGAKYQKKALVNWFSKTLQHFRCNLTLYLLDQITF